MARRGLVPGAGECLVAEGGGAAAGPVGGPRPLGRRKDCLVHLGEAAERLARPIGVPQRQPAGEPGRLGEVLALGLAVACRDAKGAIEIASGQRSPDLQLALEPPAVGPAELARGIQQDGLDAVVQALLAPPAQAVEGEARIVAQRRRHRLDRAIDPAAAPLQRHPRLGEPAVARRHALEHPFRRGAAQVPEQAVEPGDVILLAQMAAVLREEAGVLARREVAVDPGLADQRDRLVVGADREQRLGVADPAARRERRPLGEEGADQRMVGGIANRLLGDDLQLLGLGPVGIGHQEAGHGREVGGLAVLHHAQPAQRLGRQRIADQLEQARGVHPVAAPGGAKRLAGHDPILGIQRLGRQRRDEHRRCEQEADRQPARRPRQYAHAAQRQDMGTALDGSRSLAIRGLRDFALCLPPLAPALMVQQR